MTENNNNTNYELTNDKEIAVISINDNVNNLDDKSITVEAIAGDMKIRIKFDNNILANSKNSLGNNISFSIPEATSTSRVDSVLLQVDLVNKCAKILYREGTVVDGLFTPSLTSNDAINEYRLANIYVYITSTDNTSTTNLLVYEDNSFESQELIDVTQNGVQPNVELTDLSSALNNEPNVIYYFPEGTYRIKQHNFQNCSNVTIFAPKATFIYSGTFDENNTNKDNTLFNFIDCEYCKIIGGVYNGNNTKLKYGIWFYNSLYSTIKDVEVKNIGNSSTISSAGINFSKNCSNSIIENVKVHNVQAGEKQGNYIFASGIAFNSDKITGSNENGNKTEIIYSKNVVIKDVYIYDIGTIQYGTTPVDGDGIFIIQRPEYVATKLEPTNDETKALNEEYKSAEAGTYYHYREALEGEKKTRIVVTVTENKSNGSTSKEVALRIEEFCEAESNIDIINPIISTCSKRAIKVSTWGVNIYGGDINIAGWSTAVEYQYTRNSTVKDVHITNRGMTCLTICGGDGTMVVDNCHFYSNGEGNGIVFQGENGDSSNIKCGGENIIISNCDFENVKYPIYSQLIDQTAVLSESITIKDCIIGYFKGDSAIYLNPNRFNSLDKLSISNITFKHGDCTHKIFNANNTFYNKEDTNVNTNLIYLGTGCKPINPISSLIIDIDSLKEDFKEIFKTYMFNTKYIYLNKSTVLPQFSYEYPELVTITSDDTNETNTLTATSSAKNLIQITGTPNSQNQYVYMGIQELNLLSRTDYVIMITSNVIYSGSAVSVGLYDNIKKTRVGPEIPLDSYDKVVEFTADKNLTARSICIKLKKTTNSNPTAIKNTNITFRVTSKLPVYKGIL